MSETPRKAPDTIRTHRLSLSLLKADHAEIVLDFLLRNRDFFIPTEPKRREEYYTLEFQKALLGEEYALSKTFRSLLRYWVFIKGESRVIGSVMLAKPLRTSFDSCIIAYRLDKEYMRQGLMTEAARAVMKLAFLQLGIRRIEANIMPRNRASRNTAHRLGFREFGYTPKFLEINGVKEDHIRTELTKKQWEAGRLTDISRKDCSES